MPEKTSPAVAVIVDYSCDACGEGNMVYQQGSPALLVNPPRYAHVCDKCGARMHLQAVYPRSEIRRHAP